VNVEPDEPVPVEGDFDPPVFPSGAVLAAGQVVHRGRWCQVDVDSGGDGFLREVVRTEDGGVLPVIAVGEHVLVARLDDVDVAVTDFVALSAGRDKPLEPVEKRLAVGALGRHVDPFVAELPAADDGRGEVLLPCRREAGVALVAPLHRGSDRLPAREGGFVPHADFVAVQE